LTQAIKDVQWLARTLIPLGLLLVPWVPAWFLLLAALPLSRSTQPKHWVATAQSWRRAWLTWAIGSCLLQVCIV